MHGVDSVSFGCEGVSGNTIAGGRPKIKCKVYSTKLICVIIDTFSVYFFILEKKMTHNQIIIV